MDSNERDTTAEILAHIKKLLIERDIAKIPYGEEQFPDLVFVHDYLVRLREELHDISQGELSIDISPHGILSGSLKKLQARLLQLVWQLQQVANGDLSHRFDYLGEFSSSFNDVVTQLDAALTALRRKEDELTKLTDTLRHEIRLRGEALTALSQSEANFRYQASHDALTGVYNRRSFFDLAGEGLRQSALAGQPCCIALLDLDDFKQFNDTFGHIDGDEALRHITKTVSLGLRKQDIIARYGGEEFVCMFPELDLKRARTVLERLRARVEKNPVKSCNGAVPVTTSIGFVCVMPPPEVEQVGAAQNGKRRQGDCFERNAVFLEKVLRQADAYLYRSKSNGKNRVEGGIYEDQPDNACEMQAINAS